MATPQRPPLGLIRLGGAITGIMVGLLVGVLLPGAQWLWLCPLLAVAGAWALVRLSTNQQGDKET